MGAGGGKGHVHVVAMPGAVSACRQLRPSPGSLTGQGYHYKKAWVSAPVGTDVDCPECLNFLERWKSRKPELTFLLPRDRGRYWYRQGGMA